ncbi:hypothetical protein QU487_01745 [Crenobacter sp. SG2305]|uniref:tRNA (guanine(46)-N(7))-methyltransferase TrmB n=1 Tax=Crenobacter oryzisoli TaxID=3056844 RepID=UPI0025AA38EA|nr:hypothetical protein [Crenobacter sp. SG2305]MDN0081481.1 hypothetical protein [Crenobacter sp. SG2305]
MVLDTGCGVDLSTIRLAEQYPDHFVLGVDPSFDRLSRAKPLALPDNALLLRADLVDLWRLMVDDGVQLAQHWLFYPNPWPERHHLQRRWLGHVVFPLLPKLGGVMELRSNWAIYVEGFALGLSALAARGLPGPVRAETPRLGLCTAAGAAGSGSRGLVRAGGSVRPVSSSPQGRCAAARLGCFAVSLAFCRFLKQESSCTSTFSASAAPSWAASPPSPSRPATASPVATPTSTHR